MESREGTYVEDDEACWAITAVVSGPAAQVGDVVRRSYKSTERCNDGCAAKDCQTEGRLGGAFGREAWILFCSSHLVEVMFGT